MSLPVITAVEFRDDTDRASAWMPGGRRTVVATFTDGSTIDLVSYYGDEHTFSEGTFAGLTETQPLSRFHEHDVGYLRSP